MQPPNMGWYGAWSKNSQYGAFAGTAALVFCSLTETRNRRNISVPGLLFNPSHSGSYSILTSTTREPVVSTAPGSTSIGEPGMRYCANVLICNNSRSVIWKSLPFSSERCIVQIGSSGCGAVFGTKMGLMVDRTLNMQAYSGP